MSSGSLGFSNNSVKTFLPILELIVPLSIKITNFPNWFPSNGIAIGSVSVSFKILDISDIIQLFTAFGLLHTFIALSNKSDKYFDAVIIFASFSDNSYSFKYLSFLVSGNSGKVFLIFSIYSSESFIATKSGSGKYL